MRYFVDISYKGTSFHGWQKQPNAITVQGEIEKAFSLILREEVSFTASGRTDAGVHAMQQIAHLDCNQEIDNEKFEFKINSFLHKDFSINSIRKVTANAHARFDAIERTYHYFINKKKSPFSQGLSWYNRKNLNLKKMNEATEFLLTYKDFTSFSKLNTDTPHNLCDIKFAHWQEEEDQLKFVITANRFLRGMVRAVVGTMVDIGIGKITVDDFSEIIQAKDRKVAGSNAPSDGLFLAKIKYPETIYL